MGTDPVVPGTGHHLARVPNSKALAISVIKVHIVGALKAGWLGYHKKIAVG